MIVNSGQIYFRQRGTWPGCEALGGFGTGDDAEAFGLCLGELSVRQRDQLLAGHCERRASAGIDTIIESMHR